MFFAFTSSGNVATIRHNKTRQDKTNKQVMMLITRCMISFVLAYTCTLILIQPIDVLATYTYQRETVTRSPFAHENTLSNKHMLRLGGTISYATYDDFRFYGQQILDAWIFFIEWVNEERGGVMINGTNYSVSLAYMDDFSDIEYVKKGYEFLLGTESILEGLDFMLSPYSSHLTDVAQQVAINEVQCSTLQCSTGEYSCM